MSEHTAHTPERAYPLPATSLTAKDMFGTVTGYDEIAVRQQYGRDLASLRDDPFMFSRALVFIHRRRVTGCSDPEAHTAALELTLDEVQRYFTEEDKADLGKDKPAS